MVDLILQTECLYIVGRRWIGPKADSLSRDELKLLLDRLPQPTKRREG